MSRYAMWSAVSAARRCLAVGSGAMIVGVVDSQKPRRRRDLQAKRLWTTPSMCFSGSQARLDPPRIFATTADSIVLVKTPTSQGSGVVWDLEGHVTTNAHIVMGLEQVKIHVQGKDYQAQVLGTDETKDLALLKAAQSLPVKPMPRDKACKIGVGDRVFAIGFPSGQQMMTQGMISSITGLEGHESDIVVDVRLNPGNSGGAVINETGNMIGMPRAVNSKGMGMGFVIPVPVIEESVPLMIAGKSQDQEILRQLHHEVEEVFEGLGIKLTPKGKERVDKKDVHMYSAEISRLGGLLGTTKIMIFVQDGNRSRVSRVKLLAAFVGHAPRAKLMEAVNKWNNEKDFTRAYIDGDGDPRLELDIVSYGLKDTLPELFTIFHTSATAFAVEVAM